jgi:tetratricopeptide (TPR) repeat protein
MLALAALGQAARWVFRPDPLDDLRHADALFLAGRYHDARAAYVALTSRAPRFAPAFVRLGIVYAVRDERASANETLSTALGLGLSQGDRDLVRLYQGRVAAADGRRDEAARFWDAIDTRAALFPLRRVLEAESLLAIADYAGAEAAYRDALRPELPRKWWMLVDTRLALLRASSDPVAALALLNRPDARDGPAPATADVWTAPLVPLADPDARQLAEALSAPDDQRAQLLGQLFLRARLYALADAQFAAVAPGSPSSLAAAAYAAYTRWSAGDREEGLRRLQALVVAYPSEPRPRALLALAYLSTRDEAAARAQLEAVRSLAPRAPDTHLAWGQWYAARHDYLAAADEYRRALGDAPPEARAAYALALASFHVDTSFRTCEDGKPAAEQATHALPADPRAWVALAAARLSCGDAAGARGAAEEALLRNPGSAEASYYLGRALALLGERPAARQALINAADLAPASAWRERAESQIDVLGL